MNEREFLIKLKARAQEQEKIMREMPQPRLFQTVSIWLGEHPWRIGIPFAFILTLIFQFTFGIAYDDLVLKIFGGFGLFK